MFHHVNMAVLKSHPKLHVWTEGIPYPFNRQLHKMVRHTQTIRRQFGDELFECV